MKFSTQLILITIFLLSTIPLALAKEAQTNREIFVEKTGDILQVSVVAAAYLPTLLLKDVEGQYQFYKSFLTNIGITYTLKYVIPAQRPEQNGDHSFPSGHTSASFQSAAFIHKRYGLKYGLPAYAVASFVGYSRDEGDKHHWYDIFAGAALGVASSFYFTTPYKNVQVAPYVEYSNVGIAIQKAW